MDIIWQAYLGETVLAFLMFTLGAGLASFVHLVVYRYLVATKGKKQKLSWEKFLHSIFLGRSYCDKCKRTLTLKDLIPVINIFFTGGKCPKCGYRVPVKYVAGEAFLGVVFLVLFLARGALFTSSLGLVLACMVTVLLFFFTLFDLEGRIVPDPLLLPLIGLLFALTLINALVSADYWLFVEKLITAVLGFGFIYLVILTTKGKGFGLGDAKYMFALGLLLGKYLIIVTYIAIILGAIIGLCCFYYHKMRTSAKVKFKTYSIPFIPFLSFGALLMYIKGDEIFELVKSFFTI